MAKVFIPVESKGLEKSIMREYESARSRIKRGGGISGIDEKKFVQPLGRIRQSADEFTKSMEASNARVIAFGASVGVINAVQKAFTDLVKTTVRVEKILTDINVVLGTNQKSLAKFA